MICRLSGHHQLSRVSPVGATYRAIPPLWQIGADDIIEQSAEWYLDGNPTGISGEDDYVAAAGEVSCVWLASVVGKESRTTTSNAIAVAESTSVSRFIAPDATKITEFTDNSGNTFSTFSNGAHKFEIHNNYLRRVWGSASWYHVNRNDDIGPNQYAEVTYKAPDVLSVPADWKDIGVGPAVRSSPSTIDVTTNPDDYQAYAAVFGERSGKLNLYLTKPTTFANKNPWDIALAFIEIPFAEYSGKQLTVGISAVGSTIKVYLDGVEVMSAEDAEYTVGNVGIIGRGSDAADTRARNNGVLSFDAREAV